jgi:hypothetical protein
MSPPLLFLFTFAFLFPNTLAQVATPRFTDCFSGNASLKLNVSTVYAQITTSQSLGRHLNITVLGQSPQIIQGTSNGSSDLGASHLLPFHRVSFKHRRNLQPPCSLTQRSSHSISSITTHFSAKRCALHPLYQHRTTSRGSIVPSQLVPSPFPPMLLSLRAVSWPPCRRPCAPWTRSATSCSA